MGPVVARSTRHSFSRPASVCPTPSRWWRALLSSGSACLAAPKNEAFSSQHGLDNNAKHPFRVGMWSRCELMRIVFWLCQSYVQFSGCADCFGCVLLFLGFFFSLLPLLFIQFTFFPTCSHMQHSHGVTAVTKGYKRIRTMQNSG